MKSVTSIPMSVRAAIVVALAAIGLAIGFIAVQERMTAAALPNGTNADLSSLLGKLRIALLLLAVAFTGLIYLAVVIGKMRAKQNGLNPADAEIALDAANSSGAEELATIPMASILPSVEAGQLMSAGGLVRRFCHELNNAIGPIHGYAELLANDARLTEPQRRQIVRIGHAAETALQAIQDFAAVLAWSTERGTIVRLGEIVTAAATAAQSALGTRIAVEVIPGDDVQITATEAEAGQAILHLCAAIVPLLNARDAAIKIGVDSVVGAASSNIDDGTGIGRRLEIWSDPFDPERTRVQFGALQGSWRYGRVRFSCGGHGWPRELAGRLFATELSDDHDSSCLSMSVLGGLMLDLGGVIMIDTCPLKDTLVTLLWPARIASEVAAPLEIDTAEDDLDALIIHQVEPAAEALSRRLGDFGLRVASTTSPETALDLIAEMGARCRAVLIGETGDPALHAKVSAIRPDARVLFLGSETGGEIWQIDPDVENLAHLASRLQRSETRGAPS